MSYHGSPYYPDEGQVGSIDLSDLVSEQLGGRYLAYWLEDGTLCACNAKECLDSEEDPPKIGELDWDDDLDEDQNKEAAVVEIIDLLGQL